ncbi:hypothetical protein GLOIN_2v1560735 [Rhizophagus clarus]|uniref:Uncharacterized protein n=1 Tax=Rhizophagus clarus TaxID=94130 RepID=A0A8H3MCC9_9GLOM|nr:hypothetical protein GLOIN_2v1560735 [Rhizophagus clarus]
MGNNISEHKKLLQTVSTHIHDNKPNKECVEKLEKLERVTNKIHERVKQQINETNTLISITEQHLNLTKQDWIGNFMREVVQKVELKNMDKFIQTLYNIGFFEEDEEQEDEQENEGIENEKRKKMRRTRNSKMLSKMRDISNSRVHKTDSSQADGS